jgi:hypothetical protein
MGMLIEWVVHELLVIEHMPRMDNLMLLALWPIKIVSGYIEGVLRMGHLVLIFLESLRIQPKYFYKK